MPTRTREQNIGWRLDYFFVVSALMETVTDALITIRAMVAAHCPVELRLNI